MTVSCDCSMVNSLQTAAVLKFIYWHQLWHD